MVKKTIINLRSTLIIISLIFIGGCYTYIPSITDQMDYCYNDTYSGIDSLINIDGYYEYELKFVNDTNISTRKEIVFFYNNGIFLSVTKSQFEFYEGKNDKSILETLDWGLFKVSNDTIHVQYIYIHPATSGYVSKAFKIIDHLTIESIFAKNASCKQIQRSYDISNGIFKSHPNKPDPNYSKIIKKEWFWCNETDWQNYMDEERKKRENK